MWHKKHFSSFLKDFQLPKIVSDLRVCLKGRLLANVSNKETEGDIRSCIVINISNTTCHEKSLKYNFLFFSKFKFD